MSTMTGMGSAKMHIMDDTGDTTVEWSTDDPESVEMARRAFKRMTKRGYQALRDDGEGEGATHMEEFDPEARKVVFSPQLAGG